MDLFSAKPFWTISSFDPQCLPEFAVETFQEVLPYVQEFLCAPHPFREGVVCPFVPSALKNNRIYFTICADNDSAKSHSVDIQIAIEFYLQRKREAKGFGALIILFPKDYDVGRLLELHFQNKEKCVLQSLMLGALYKTNQAPSLHKKDYFPLRTPTPVLVIRDMVVSDLIFLDPKHYNIKKRLSFLKAFLHSFESHKSLVAKEQIKEAKRLYQFYKRKWYIRFFLKIIAMILMCTLLVFLVLNLKI